MNPLTLKYQSQPKIYGFRLVLEPNCYEVNDLTVYESFLPNSDYERFDTRLGDYRITIEADVKDKSELIPTSEKISKVAKSIDLVWMYACGHPFTKKQFSFLAPHIEPLDGSLPGWENNFDDVSKEFDKGKRRIEISSQEFHWAIYDDFPLSKALKIRAKYFKASEAIKTLIDLHYSAHKVADDYSMCFFLAKGLELVRYLLPGKSTTEKQKGLPVEVSKNLLGSFNQVYDLSNNRIETRHVMRVPKNLDLHPRMTNNEIKIFKHDADQIIRAVVSERLGSEPLISIVNE